MRKIIVGAIVLGVAFTAMRMQGMGFSDLVAFATGEVKQARSDAKALTSGEYSDRIARKLRDEAAAQPSARGGSYDSELNRELAADRKRMIEQRAESVQKLGAEMLRGDVETLKRQVRTQAREAGNSP